MPGRNHFAHADRVLWPTGFDRGETSSAFRLAPKPFDRGAALGDQCVHIVIGKGRRGETANHQREPRVCSSSCAFPFLFRSDGGRAVFQSLF